MHRINIKVAAHTRQLRPGVWRAFVLMDGRPTDKGCGHLHHSENAAAKCTSTLAARVQLLMDNCKAYRMLDKNWYEVVSRDPDGRELTFRFSFADSE